jgi:hypothetical protein
VSEAPCPLQRQEWKPAVAGDQTDASHWKSNKVSRRSRHAVLGEPHKVYHLDKER